MDKNPKDIKAIFSEAIEKQTPQEQAAVIGVRQIFLALKIGSL